MRRILSGSEPYLKFMSDRTIALPIEVLLDSALLPETHSPDTIDFARGAPRCELVLNLNHELNLNQTLNPWGHDELRQLIRQKMTAETNQDFANKSDILVTHGASGAFATVAETFINPGRRVVLLDPTSPIFPLILKHRRASIRWVNTTISDGYVRFDIEDFAAAMRGATMLVIANPNNPTGGQFAAEDFEQISWWAKKYDVLIYIDQSFANYQDEMNRLSLAGFPSCYQRLLLAQSVSKSVGLASARVGWLMGARTLMNAWTLTANVHSPFMSPLSQQIAVHALRHGDSAARLHSDEMAGRRRYIFEYLRSIGLAPLMPSCGFFMWIPVQSLNLSGREFSLRLFRSKKLLLNPGDPFGPSGIGYVRLSYATDDGRLREGLARLGEFMQELHQGKEPAQPQQTWQAAADARLASPH